MSDKEIKKRLRELRKQYGAYGCLQRCELYYGLKNGVDVTKYADPAYTSEQMKQLRVGLEDGVDVTPYAAIHFSADQMREIRRGLLDGLDVSCYADPKYNAEKMRNRRENAEIQLAEDLYRVQRKREGGRNG